MLGDFVRSPQNNFPQLCYSASVADLLRLQSKLEDLVVVLGESNGRERSFRRALQRQFQNTGHTTRG